MAKPEELGLRLVQRREKDLHGYLKATERTFSHVTHLLAQYRHACEEVILNDPEPATVKAIDSRLWDFHGKVNNIFRKELKPFEIPAGLKKSVEKRKISKDFLDFIKSSQCFYRGYIQRLVSHWDNVPELRAVADRLTLSTLLVDEPSQICGLISQLALLSYHQTLIRLGDLSRWRETQLVTKNRNWGPAIGYYDLANIIHPDSGASYNQLAVISLVDRNHLQATYHLYRALAVLEPHPSAKGNLEIEFKKINDAWSKGKSIVLNADQTSQGSDRTLIEGFIRLHAQCYNGADFADHDELESDLLGQLAVDLKERSLEGTLNKFALTNIAAEYFASIRLRENRQSAVVRQSFFYFQRLNVRTYFTLLQILLQELECSIPASTSDNVVGSGSSKLSAVMFRVLPALRNYSSWMMANAELLAARVGDSQLVIQTKELWNIYATTLTLLASTFSVSELRKLPLDGYLLEEDEDTLGFSPFENEHTRNRYIDKETGAQKPSWHDRGVQRHHYNVEMLIRIRDFLTAGMILHLQENVPIQLVDTTFVHVEDDGLPYNFQQKNVSTNAAQEELTHVDETKFQDTCQSATETGSRKSSASVSLDNASKRMVDDLVNSELGDDGNAEPSRRLLFNESSVNNVHDETSYGLIGSATVRELECMQDQSRLVSTQPLPSIHNPPLAAQVNEKEISSQPATATRIANSHSSRDSQKCSLIQQQRTEINAISSTDSSIPDPTNGEPPLNAQYINQPFKEPKYPTKTNYTTGGMSSTLYSNDTYGIHDDPSFISPPGDWGNSGSVRETTDVQTPPNGQGLH